MAAPEVNSNCTKRFWDLFNALPKEVQDLAVKSYHLWCNDPNHPSLHFRRLQGSPDRFTVRIGNHHRALASFEGIRLRGSGSARMLNMIGWLATEPQGRRSVRSIEPDDPFRYSLPARAE